MLVLKPYEIWNKLNTIQDTQDKIKLFKKLKVIGITGSYAKTSVKEILYHILKSKYKVLKTPKSYNTVFGIAKVVALELDDTYDYFICEMGAYKRGDIKELCEMVFPIYGILTGIAEQHIDRFGSLENIIEGKFELIDSLPASGFAVLNGDNPHIANKISEVSIPYILYGLDIKKTGVKAEKISLSDSGTAFLLNINGNIKTVNTRLLGRSSIQNILGAITMASQLGMSISEICDAVKTLEPVSNRLELIKQGGLTIINDAYNSNPVGFLEAIETARLFKSKKKILVTPGIVDLADRNDEIHENLGKQSAGIFDYIVLVTDSVRTRSLKKGLLSTGMDNNKVILVNDLNDARKWLESNASEDSLVVFENDLPDNY